MHGPPPPEQPPSGGGAGKPPLPKWFALRGPEPGWLARNWSLALAIISGLALALNNILSARLVSPELYNHVTTWVAWLSTAALYLQNRQTKITKVATWRAQVRAQEAAKTDPKP